MNRIIVKSRVDGDGVLRVNVPIGKDEADQEVQVTVEPVGPKKPMTQEEYAAWVEAMAGSITDPTFERPPQCLHEERLPLGPAETMTQEEWRRRVLATAGKWQGDFERPAQGELEEREPLS